MTSLGKLIEVGGSMRPLGSGEFRLILDSRDQPKPHTMSEFRQVGCPSRGKARLADGDAEPAG
jgi:hypothetical protein